MAGLGDNIGLLMRIRADSTDAVKDLNRVQSEIKGVGNAATTTSGSFTSMVNPAALAATAVASIGAAALAAGVSLFNLAKSTSDYGSEIFDATQKTGLGATAISSLKVAAETSGSSLDAVTRGIALFAKQYKGTSQELQVELGKVFKQIADAKPGFEQLTLAQKNFGRSGADLIPVIKSFDGNLDGLIETMTKAGVTMDDKAAAAADRFGDTLDILKLQAAGFGRQMALEFMPAITAAMAAVSASMVSNKDVAQGWGRALAETMDGVTAVYRAGGSVLDSVFNAIGAGFLSTAEKARIFAGVMITALSPVLGILNLIGRASGLNAQIGGSVNIPDTPNISIPRLGGGGGGRRAGGGAVGDPNKEAFQREVEALRRILAESEAISDSVMARYEADLALGLIKENQFTAYRISLINAGMQAKLEALQMEREAAVKNNQSTLDIDSKIKIQKEKIQTQLIKNEKELEEERQKNHKKELERIEEEAEARRKSQEAYFKRQKAYKAYDDSIAQIGRDAAAGALGTAGGALAQNITLGAQAQVVALDTLRDAFQGLGQAIGSAVQAWVLYGNVGGMSARKVTAQILAAVAQQAAVKAIFEVAEGFARLAVGDGAGAALHFKSAAMYGAVAAVAAVAGRAVAGNAFNQQTADGGASGSGAQVEQNNSFGGFFNGFQTRQERIMAQMTDRTNAVMGAAAAAIDRFNDKFGIASPADVVMAGAGGASAAIFNANVNEMSKGGSASEMFARASGRFR